MDVERLRDSPAGDLVPITGSEPRTGEPYQHFAFVPALLPNQPSGLSMETLAALEQASISLGALRNVCKSLPNPQLLIRPALYSEATATSALEGTYSELDEVMESQLPGASLATPEIREIDAYIRMANHGFESVQEGRPISRSLVCDLQKILADGSKTVPAEAGKIRTGQVVIGPEGCRIADSRFVPPPPLQFEDGVEHLFDWLQRDPVMPELIRVALTHYQFESLHPFNDCNGRVGRLLTILQMLDKRLLDEPYLTISPWFLRRRDQYQDLLLAVSQTGDFNTWITFFANAVAEQSEAHVRVASELLQWQTALKDELFKRKWSGVIAQVADRLIEWPILTNRTIQDLFEVSAPTAKGVTDRLVDIGALTVLGSTKYRRSFGAVEVMQLVDSL